MGGSIEPPFLLPQEDRTVAKQPARARCWPALHTKGPRGQQRRPERTRPHAGDKPHHRRPPCRTKHEASDCSPPKTSWAAIRAIPESDGTYRDVARKAEQYGGNFHHQTIANWIRHGRADVAASQPSTAYARFTKRYRELIDEHWRTGHQPEPRIRPSTRDPRTDLRVQ